MAVKILPDTRAERTVLEASRKVDICAKYRDSYSARMLGAAVSAMTSCDG